MLMIAGVAVSVFIAWLMVRLRLLDRIAARLQGWRWAFSTLAIGFLFFVVSDVLRLPWTLFADWHIRSEEHTSELQSLMRISYAVFCLKKKTTKILRDIKITHHRYYEDKHCTKY